MAPRKPLKILGKIAGCDGLLYTPAILLVGKEIRYTLITRIDSPQS